MAETWCIPFGLVVWLRKIGFTASGISLVVKLSIERYSRFRLYRLSYVVLYNILSGVLQVVHLLMRGEISTLFVEILLFFLIQMDRRFVVE